MKLPLETALCGNIQNIVTDTETTAKDTIEYLKKHRFGRATFFAFKQYEQQDEL